ncbi:MAG: universal stress protein [Proteobacteria bacterium]|nr:universal stress protein [Pseudomonadota bacterium]
MPMKDLLIHLDSYPDATPLRDVDEAVAFAALMRAKLTALAIGVSIPLETNRAIDRLVGLSNMVAEEEARSETICRRLLAEFKARAKAARVFGGANLDSTDVYDVSDLVAREARTRDLCLVPLGGRYTGQREVAQAVMFDSGRPVLMYDGAHARFSKGLGTAVIAWDGGPCAARAVAEALPILQRAAEVRVLLVLGEKASTYSGLAAEIVRHLGSHGIKPVVDEVNAAGRSIATVFDAHIKRHAPDLWVMGAYGHSRLREFILGGATEHMLWKGKVPTLLAH